MRAFTVITAIILFTGCSSMKFDKTVDYIDIPKFMGNWYVIAGRTTFLESGAHNSLEIYEWNEKEQRIDIGFTFKKNSFDGKDKSLPQKAWIHNKKTNAHWKVQPFWPLKFDYLVLDVAPDYSWTVIGVSNQKYVWIMSRDWKMEQSQLDEIITKLENMGYNTKDIERVPQKW